MKRIFISTNVISSGLLFHEYYGDLWKRLCAIGFDLLKSKDVIFFDTDNKKFSAQNSRANIILIRDEITDLPIEGITINDYLLWHTPTKDKIKNKFKNLKQGQHTAEDKHLYFPVFKIILNDSIAPTEKINKIIECVFPEKEKQRNVVLEFLHGCLEKQTKGEELQTSDFKNIVDVGVDTQEFCEKFINKPITNAMIIDMRNKWQVVALEN